MSFLLTCPHCGPREVYEFRYGGQILTAGQTKSNLPEAQQERWYHRHGCRRWFSVIRDVQSNTVAYVGPLTAPPASSTTHEKPR